MGELAVILHWAKDRRFVKRGPRMARERTRAPGEVVLEHDVISEALIIAAALLNASDRGRLLAAIPIDRMIEPKHRMAWEGLAEIERRKLGFDFATLQKVAPKVDVEYLKQLVQDRPDPPENLSFHIEQILWDGARLNAASGPIASLVEALKDPTTDPERIKSLARQVPQAFEGYKGRSYLRDSDQVVHEMMTDVKSRQDEVQSYSYGIDRLDYFEKDAPEGYAIRRMIPGAAPGKTTIITGMTGAGKTTVTARMALGLARNKRNVLYGAWEMRGNVTLELLACMSLGYQRSRLHAPEAKGGLHKEEMILLEERANAISKRIRFLDMPFNRKLGESSKRRDGNQRNLDTIHQYISDSGCDIFIADLWKRCLVETRAEDEELALERQQSMLEETKVHGILVHQQLTKGDQVRSDKRPTAEGAKGSAMWSESADTMIGIHRPGKYKAIDDNIMEIIILKQRFGKCPMIVEFDWDPETGLITGGITRPYDYGEGEGDTMEAFFKGQATARKKKH